MRKLIFILLFSPVVSFSQENNSQAAKDLAIVDGEYVLTKGSSEFCSAGGPVGWIQTQKSDTNKDNYMLMVGTKLIFININKPDSKQTIADCEYTAKTDTKRISGVGFLTEIETSSCKNVNRQTRRNVRFEKERITVEVQSKMEENGQKSSFTAECEFELNRASRFQQSVEK